MAPSPHALALNQPCQASQVKSSRVKTSAQVAGRLPAGTAALPALSGPLQAGGDLNATPAPAGRAGTPVRCGLPGTTRAPHPDGGYLVQESRHPGLPRLLPRSAAGEGGRADVGSGVQNVRAGVRIEGRCTDVRPGGCGPRAASRGLRLASPHSSATQHSPAWHDAGQHREPRRGAGQRCVGWPAATGAAPAAEPQQRCKRCCTRRGAAPALAPVGACKHVPSTLCSGQKAGGSDPAWGCCSF